MIEIWLSCYIRACMHAWKDLLYYNILLLRFALFRRDLRRLPAFIQDCFVRFLLHDSPSNTSPTPPPTPSLTPLTPAPLSKTTDTPSEDEEEHEVMLRHHVHGRALSERSRETGSWARPFGYDIQKDEQRRWVCRACIRKKDLCPGNFDSDVIQNAYNHLFTEHGIRAPFSKTGGTAEKKADSIGVKATGQKSIVEVMKLDLHNPREQAEEQNNLKMAHMTDVKLQEWATAWLENVDECRQEESGWE